MSAAVPFTSVTVTDRFWSRIMETCRTKTIHACIRQCEETGRIRNFARAAGRDDSPHEGTFFNDSDVYKLLEGIAYSLHFHPDADLEAKADKIIEQIAAAQKPDGYLNTYFQLVRPGDKWTDMDLHEMYCGGHLLEAGIAYRQATSKDALLQVGMRLANHVESLFDPGKRHWVPGHQEIELALLQLYQFSGEERYLRPGPVPARRAGPRPRRAGGKYREAGYRIQVATGCPWDGRVRIAVESTPEGASLGLRIPGWCADFSLAGGDCLLEMGYALVKVRPGQELTLTLSMPVARNHSVDAVFEDRGCVVLSRGPLVYCVEEGDCVVPFGELRFPDRATVRYVLEKQPTFKKRQRVPLLICRYTMFRQYLTSLFYMAFQAWGTDCLSITPPYSQTAARKAHGHSGR